MKEGFENSSPSENLERPLTGRSDIPFVDPAPITFDIPIDMLLSTFSASSKSLSSR